jgi:hypothetical protein
VATVAEGSLTVVDSSSVFECDLPRASRREMGSMFAG